MSSQLSSFPHFEECVADSNLLFPCRSPLRVPRVPRVRQPAVPGVPRLLGCGRPRTPTGGARPYGAEGPLLHRPDLPGTRPPGLPSGDFPQACGVRGAVRPRGGVPGCHPDPAPLAARAPEEPSRPGAGGARRLSPGRVRGPGRSQLGTAAHAVVRLLRHW